SVRSTCPAPPRSWRRQRGGSSARLRTAAWWRCSIRAWARRGIDGTSSAPCRPCTAPATGPEPRRSFAYCGGDTRGVALALVHLQPVADPPHRHDELGVVGLVLDLHPQPADVGVDEAAVAEVVVAPHPLEELVAAQHHAGMVRELAQQQELGLR